MLYDACNKKKKVLPTQGLLQTQTKSKKKNNNMENQIIIRKTFILNNSL